jgi:hypothetical protein
VVMDDSGDFSVGGGRTGQDRQAAVICSLGSVIITDLDMRS